MSQIFLYVLVIARGKGNIWRWKNVAQSLPHFAHSTHLVCTTYTQPDRPFCNFRASKSGDRLLLCSSETSCDGFWGFKVAKRSVGRVQYLFFPLCLNAPTSFYYYYSPLGFIVYLFGSLPVCVSVCPYVCNDVPVSVWPPASWSFSSLFPFLSFSPVSSSSSSSSHELATYDMSFCMHTRLLVLELGLVVRLVELHTGRNEFHDHYSWKKEEEEEKKE